MLAVSEWGKELTRDMTCDTYHEYGTDKDSSSNNDTTTTLSSKDNEKWDTKSIVAV